MTDKYVLVPVLGEVEALEAAKDYILEHDNSGESSTIIEKISRVIYRYKKNAELEEKIKKIQEHFDFSNGVNYEGWCWEFGEEGARIRLNEAIAKQTSELNEISREFIPILSEKIGSDLLTGIAELKRAWIFDDSPDRQNKRWIAEENLKATIRAITASAKSEGGKDSDHA